MRCLFAIYGLIGQDILIDRYYRPLAGPGQADQPKEELVYFGANSLIGERSNRAEISICVKSKKIFPFTLFCFF